MWAIWGSLPLPFGQGPQLQTAGLSWQKVRRLHLTEDGSPWWISRLPNEVKATDLGRLCFFSFHSISPSQTTPLIPANHFTSMCNRWQRDKIKVNESYLENSDRKSLSLRNGNYKVPHVIHTATPWGTRSRHFYHRSADKKTKTLIQSNPRIRIRVFFNHPTALTLQQESHSLGMSFDSHMNPMK